MADTCRVALAEGDIDAAAALAEDYLAAVAEHAIPLEIWQSHELMGLVALEQGRAEVALAELGQANPNDARVMLAVARAHALSGDNSSARKMLQQVVDFNALNQAPQSLALARPLAMAMLGG